MPQKFSSHNNYGTRECSKKDCALILMNDGQGKLGDNCIQNVHLGRYIIGYMVGNFVLWWRVGRAIKHNFRPYNRRYTSPNDNFEYGYPHSNALNNIYLSKTQYFAPNWSFVSNVKQLCQQATSLMTTVLWQCIAEFTDTNSWRYPVRRHVTFASALGLPV